MNIFLRKKKIELIAVIVTFGFIVGCGPKASEKVTHVESASLSTIRQEIYDDCLDNKDYDGAKEVLDTYLHLMAFYCKPYTEVNYDDVKNRKYENIEYDIGELQIALAAYNEYNDESAMDVEVDWICQYNLSTQEQQDAIEAYVEWFHTAQNGNYEGTIEKYDDEVGAAYIKILLNFDLDTTVGHTSLTPAQFREVQKYMKDPNYQVDTSVWD